MGVYAASSQELWSHRTGSQTVLMTVSPWDPEAPAAFEGPDIGTGPGGGQGGLKGQEIPMFSVLCE